MGRYIKGTVIPTGDYASRLPLGGAALTPANSLDGQIRFNSDLNCVEAYYNGSWNQISKVGKAEIVVDDLASPNGITYDFTMSIPETSATDVVVFIGGVYQNPGTSYTIAPASPSKTTTKISFTSPPPAPNPPLSPNRINIIHNLNSTKAV